jgi:hypothetical protein
MPATQELLTHIANRGKVRGTMADGRQVDLVPMATLNFPYLVTMGKPGVKAWAGAMYWIDKNKLTNWLESFASVKKLPRRKLKPLEPKQ